jgi:hypothetical protein
VIADNVIGHHDHEEGSLGARVRCARSSGLWWRLERHADRHRIRTASYRKHNLYNFALDMLHKLGFAAQQQGNPVRAARLRGAVEALQAQTTGFNPEQYIVHQRNLVALRAQRDPARLEACTAAGRALDWEQAIAERLAVTGTLDESGRQRNRHSGT